MNSSACSRSSSELCLKNLAKTGSATSVKTLLEHSSQVNCDQHGGYYLLRNALYNNHGGNKNILLKSKS
jgi:hypothetical protein